MLLGEDASDIAVVERQPLGDIPTNIDATMPIIVEITKIGSTVRTAAQIEVAPPRPDSGEDLAVANDDADQRPHL